MTPQVSQCSAERSLGGVPDEIFRAAEALHSGPERGYYGWSHPVALLALLAEVRGDLSDPLAVEAAILLHDAIYEPAATDNEQRSAVLGRQLLSGWLPAATVQRAGRLIEATARHAVPDDMPDADAQDCRIFLDMDLSVLGAAPEVFDRYEAGVRHEYRQIPEAVFNPGRAAILERFLGRDRLYMSDWGHERFETKARANLQRSLTALRRTASDPSG